jgi:hypothetical protein
MENLDRQGPEVMRTHREQRMTIHSFFKIVPLDKCRGLIKKQYNLEPGIPHTFNAPRFDGIPACMKDHKRNLRKTK